MTNKAKNKRKVFVLSFCIGFIIAVIVTLILTGCSLHEWNKETWHLVQSEYPDCKSMPMPEVYYNDKIEERGLYYKDLNWVILKHPNDLQALEHEFRHACGDTMNEPPLPDNWEKGI